MRRELRRKERRLLYMRVFIYSLLVMGGSLTTLVIEWKENRVVTGNGKSCYFKFITYWAISIVLGVSYFRFEILFHSDA